MYAVGATLLYNFVKFVSFNVHSVLQSISEEEQQRILAEQKMVGFKKSTGGATPGPKKSSKAKVSLLAIFFQVLLYICTSVYIYPAFLI